VNFTPNAAQLAQQVHAYVGDAESIVKASLASSKGSNAFADVYHISLSADAILRGLTDLPPVNSTRDN
jgi:hypothetical protein